MIFIVMRKPGICKCGNEYDARAKTKMCRKCFTEWRYLNRRPRTSGNQFVYKDGQTHYQKNKQYYLDKKKNRTNMLFEFLREYKKQHPCVDCGNSDIRVLDFDHISDDKEINVSECCNNGWSKKRILTEIEKCQVRCANCHRIITWERKQNAFVMVNI